MKALDWLIVSLFVLIGLACLVMSTTSMMDSHSARSYIKEIVQVCFGIGISAAVLSIIYVLVKKRRS